MVGEFIRRSIEGDILDTVAKVTELRVGFCRTFSRLFHVQRSKNFWGKERSTFNTVTTLLKPPEMTAYQYTLFDVLYKESTHLGTVQQLSSRTTTTSSAHHLALPVHYMYSD
jgi:hypothetical protein